MIWRMNVLFDPNFGIGHILGQFQGNQDLQLIFSVSTELLLCTSEALSTVFYAQSFAWKLYYQSWGLACFVNVVQVTKALVIISVQAIINHLRYADDATLMAESEEELKSLLMKVKVESWLKAQHSENEDHGIWSHHFMGNRWGNSGNSVRLYFFGLQNQCRW